MKTNFTLILSFIIFSSIMMMAQPETLFMGPAYSNQVYYDLSSGESTVVSNDAWDIAFSNEGQQDAGVFYNESAALSGTPLRVWLSQESDWSVAITDLNVYTEINQIFNPDVDWTNGAFNVVEDSPSPLDYGWGKYNPATFSVEGSKNFIIQLRDESYIKFRVDELGMNGYVFRYANLDGSNEQTATMAKNPSNGKALLYFSFDSNAEVEMPTDYDFVIQRYYTNLGTEEETIEYPVSGVLLAPGAEGVVALGVDPETVDHADYIGQYTDSLKVIGHLWKDLTPSFMWFITPDRAQFIKTADGEYYKILFYDFEGSGTGGFTFESFLIGTTNITKVEDLNVKVFPNPTTDFISIDGLADNHLSTIQIFDQQGRLMEQVNDYQNMQSIDLMNYTSGTYHVAIVTGEQQMITTIMVAK